MTLKLRVHPNDPLILDRWVDVAYMFLWGIYACWGLTTLFFGLPTIDINTPEWYSAVWAGAVGVLSALAFAACASLFFYSRVLHFVTKKKIERYAVFVLSLFILVYPVLLIFSAWDGDVDRVSLSVLSLSYIVFPTLRIYILTRRINAFQATAEEFRNAP